MASDIKEAIRRLIYRYTVEGADKVMATQEAVAASTTKTDKASLSLEKSFGNIERRYVNTVRAQQDYAKVQEKVNAAVAQNPELQERANAVLAAAGQHFNNMAAGAEKGNMATTVLARTLTRTIGPLALIGVAVAAVSSAMEFMEPIAVRVGADIYRRFSEAYPATARFAEGIYNAAKQFYDLERAQAKLEAINAALNGTASSAELAALKIESLNQKIVNQRGLAEAAQNAERMADHVRQLAQIYPGVTQEVAKQLELLQAQVGVAQARTSAEAQVAQEKLRQVQLTQQGIVGEEQQLIIAGEREVAEANIKKQQEAQNIATNSAMVAQATIGDEVDSNTQSQHNFSREIQRSTVYAYQLVDAYKEMQYWYQSLSLAGKVDARLNMMPMQFGSTQYSIAGGMNSTPQTTAADALMYRMTGKTVAEQQQAMQALIDEINNPTRITSSQDVSSPAAMQSSLANILRLGFSGGLGNVNRLLGVVTDKGSQAQLIQQTIDYIQATETPSLAREEMIVELNSKLEQLASSTDSLNSTMQNALSPFYSQDPRTTHLGFRAGVVGNPEWQVGGASNTNPLAAILGAGATAPGMANGGSFVVGGGYSANDNRIAAFPVASGEQVTVNRNRKGEGGQVIHIDNRTIINGRVDADVFAQMKVSKYQQAQRMRSGLAVA